MVQNAQGEGKKEFTGEKYLSANYIMKNNPDRVTSSQFVVLWTR